MDSPRFILIRAFIFLIVLIPSVLLDGYDRKYVKCLVCLRVVEEMKKEISSLSPSLKYNSGSYVLDSKKVQKELVEMRRSEVFLIDLLDRLCAKLNDYVRAYNKVTGIIEVIPLLINGKMNPAIQDYDIIQDGDLESVEFYCESILSEYEEKIIQLFQEGMRDIESKLCYSSEICITYSKSHDEL